MADGGTQMIKYLTMTIGKQKNIALIAHDGKKQDMLKWCMENKEILQQHIETNDPAVFVHGRKTVDRKAKSLLESRLLKFGSSDWDRLSH